MIEGKKKQKRLELTLFFLFKKRACHCSLFSVLIPLPSILCNNRIDFFLHEIKHQPDVGIV
jgi:hypothetical protein